jgi:hypothetical protein
MQNEDEGFVDFTFDIVKITEKLFGSILLECAACYEGLSVGFCLEIKNNMRGFTNSDIKTFCTYPKGMKLRYQNGLSDGFITTVSRLYGFEVTDLQLNKCSYIECGALSGNPMNLQKEKVEFKCFLQATDRSGYAEFYINVDVPQQKLYFKEKDPDYRENIIRYFSM